MRSKGKNPPPAAGAGGRICTAGPAAAAGADSPGQPARGGGALAVFRVGRNVRLTRDDGPCTLVLTRSSAGGQAEAIR